MDDAIKELAREKRERERKRGVGKYLSEYLGNMEVGEVYSKDCYYRRGFDHYEYRRIKNAVEEAKKGNDKSFDIWKDVVNYHWHCFVKRTA